MSNFLIKTLLLFFLLCLPARNYAQFQIERTEQLSFEEGLSDQEIRDIHRDANGFLWLATGIGLERYDGYVFEAFYNKQKSTPSLRDRGIESIGEGPNDNLYLVYRKNLAFIDVFNTDSLSSKRVLLNPQSGVEGQVLAAYTEERGNVYLLTSQSSTLNFWALTASMRFKKIAAIPWQLAKNERFQLLKCHKGGFCFYSNVQGFYRADAQGHIQEKHSNAQFNMGKPDQLLEPAIFYEDQKGRIWLSFKNTQGIFQLNGNEKKEGPIQACRTSSKPNACFTRIWEDAKGNLLMGARLFGEPYFYAQILGLKADGQWFDGNPLLNVENKILDIYGQDFEQLIFLGTYSGVYKVFLRNQGIQQYLATTLKKGDYGAITRSITSDGKGTIFFALEGPRWYQLDTRSNRLEPIVLHDAKGKVLELDCSGGGLAYDPEGYLWGNSCESDTSGMLHRYDLERKTTLSKHFKEFLVSFLRRPDGKFYLLFRSTSGGGSLAIFDPRTDELTTFLDARGANPFKHRIPQYIKRSQMHQNMLWVGTDFGIVGIDVLSHNTQVYGIEQSNEAWNFSSPKVLVLAEDERGDLWIGTNGGGLNVLHFENNPKEALPLPLAVEILNKKNGLSNEIVYGILPDGHGAYLISTAYGLNHYNPQTHSCGKFYAHDGLSNNEFNSFSFFKDENDRFYFGTINGLNVFKLEDLLQNTPGKRVLLSKITKFFGNTSDEAYPLGGLLHLKELELEPDFTYLQLEFFLTDYTEPSKNQFSVWLENLDKGWRQLDPSSILRYNRLPPGNYTLHLKGADAKGNWAEKEFSLPIKVHTFYYQRWWFIGTILLLFLSAVFLFARWRIRSIRKQEAWRTAMNKRFTELELKALQAQMNPHFIFNSLAAIQYFIQLGKAEEADGYLSKFAQLMRLFLESSKNKYISLAEEIRLLELYVDLEKMRFAGRFKVIFNVDSDIDTEEIEIPSMLLQPFVENAINHGLFHKTGTGHLKIGFSMEENDKIVCVVEDDGIGRKAAETMRKQSLKNYKSRAMQIVQERLEALQNVDGYNVTIEVEDLFDPENKPIGTKVMVKIPILE